MTDTLKHTIRRASDADADALAPLAAQIFHDTFAGNPLNAPDDMTAYMNEFLSVAAFERELNDADAIFYLAETAGKIIGYAKLQENTTEECVTEPHAIELQRLYVHRDFHGAGIARTLMDECFAYAAHKNYRAMWLGVWEFNHRAQSFYAKLGFRQIGTHVFQLGADAQTDWVMEKKL